MPTSRTEITLRAMRFHARIGVLPHEREHAQPVEVDLTVRLRPGTSGDSAVVDYRELYALASGALGEGHVDYLEELAETIAIGALARPRVASARVAVRKPHVALPGPLAYAEVVALDLVKVLDEPHDVLALRGDAEEVHGRSEPLDQDCVGYEIPRHHGVDVRQIVRVQPL